MNTNFKAYGIALIPIYKDKAKLYQLVEILNSNFNFNFACRKKISIPHLTIFQGNFINENDLILKIKTINIDKLNKSIAIDKVSIWASKIVFLDFILTTELKNFHNEVFKNLFPVCDGKSADPQVFKGISSLEQKMYAETGYPFSLKAYKPHITMAHLNSPVKKDKLDEITNELNFFLKESKLGDQIKFNKLVIYKVAEFGRCLADFLYEKKLS